MNIQQIAEAFQRIANNFRGVESRLKAQDEKILGLTRKLELAVKRIDDLEGAAIGAGPAPDVEGLADGEEYVEEDASDGLY